MEGRIGGIGVGERRVGRIGMEDRIGGVGVEETTVGKIAMIERIGGRMEVDETICVCKRIEERTEMKKSIGGTGVEKRRDRR